MITHVKRNSQRSGFRIPSHIENSVQFKGKEYFGSRKISGINSREDSHYFRIEQRDTNLVRERIREFERLYGLGGGLY